MQENHKDYKAFEIVSTIFAVLFAVGMFVKFLFF
jgi:hypothetical protein